MDVAPKVSILNGTRVHVYFVISVAVSVDIYRPIPLAKRSVFPTMEVQFVCATVLALGNNSRPRLCSIDLWVLKTEDARVCGRGLVFDNKGPIKVLSIGTAQEIIELVRLGIS